jgi:hypothetical protein
MQQHPTRIHITFAALAERTFGYAIVFRAFPAALRPFVCEYSPIPVRRTRLLYRNVQQSLPIGNLCGRSIAGDDHARQ